MEPRLPSAEESEKAGMYKLVLPIGYAAANSPSFGRFRISGLMLPAAAAKAAARPEPTPIGLGGAGWLADSGEGRLLGESLLGATIGPNLSLKDRTGGFGAWL